MSKIRGHRRTYNGALQSIYSVAPFESRNPVFSLMRSITNSRFSLIRFTLLEIHIRTKLDSVTISEVAFDLFAVMFITTPISGNHSAPLLDRMKAPECCYTERES
jgi:ATP-dependent Lon protease